MGGGLVNLASLLHPAWAHRRMFREIFPLEFLSVSRLVTLLVGFVLVVTSLNIVKRKHRAYQMALFFAGLGIGLHLIRGRDLEQIAYSLLLIVFLITGRRDFTVRSGAPRLRPTLSRFGIGVAVALAYGVAGFWFLDVRDFGVNFVLRDAIRHTVRVMLLQQDLGIVPRTVHARWFLDSLDLMTLTVVAYSASLLFRPAAYRMFILPHDRRTALAIVERHGRSSLDYFKPWTDKSLFLSRSRESFLAYRVGRGYALVLGDPVGPGHEIEPLAEEFIHWCHENDWGVAFHQVPPDCLSIYARLGLRKLKIGEEAVVDLASFSLDGRSMKRLRNSMHKLAGEGIRAVRFDPPLPDDVLLRAREVSADWLTLPGRRERRFTLGWFDPGYLRATPLVAAIDATGQMQAFANVIPSYAPGEATIDLMRHRADAPAGCMDFLFIELFRQCRERGFSRFSLGMAPLGGFREHEPASPEERAVHFFIGQLRSRFSFEGMRQFKGKYATSWEPRYLAYRNVLGLPRIALALTEVSEIRRREDGD
jgi:phosphatidylglycerol lysyltransferase